MKEINNSESHLRWHVLYLQCGVFCLMATTTCTCTWGLSAIGPLTECSCLGAECHWTTHGLFLPGLVPRTRPYGAENEASSCLGAECHWKPLTDCSCLGAECHWTTHGRLLVWCSSVYFHTWLHNCPGSRTLSLTLVFVICERMSVFTDKLQALVKLIRMCCTYGHVRSCMYDTCIVLIG